MNDEGHTETHLGVPFVVPPARSSAPSRSRPPSDARGLRDDQSSAEVFDRAWRMLRVRRVLAETRCRP
jgi:hypothetical protein